MLVGKQEIPWVRLQLTCSFRRSGAVPGVDDPGSGDHRQPGDDGHDDGSYIQAGDPLPKTGVRQPLRTQGVEASKTTGKCQEEQRSKPHPMDERPKFSTAK